ncbi:hypothetical protein PPERSA_04170 [Pseudocohnilembus persalinus]|uniref:Uncharacterized protein n=1 Tax=Pseudocohnilembus persalinus TaxID=266149 RepID=A0A0V0QMY0_PSEPJ|nr:hypothetical protein PPERSA_04170 [Pseudocohnilembus persalinus]|eukprot:KRX03618.1 hypothetical protein PPERSA_04170 [Pseudocohnilembus persalinus]
MSNNLQRSQQQNSLKKEEINFQTIKQIPFVNQDKDNFFQDIVHRKMYYGNLQSENGTQKFQNELVPQYEKSAPFLPSTLEFADQLIESKEQFKEKYGFEEKNLVRNKCLLETVVLSRLDQKQRQKSKIKMQKKPLTIREIQNEEELARLLEKQNQKSFEENQKLIEEMNQHQIQQIQQQYLELQQNIENDLQNGIKGKIQTQYKYNKQGLKKLEEDFKQRRAQMQQEFNKSRSGNQSFPKIQNNYSGKI